MRMWPKGGLWRHSDFLKLWSAETISQVGSQVTGLALPLVAIITLDVSAFEVALLGVVEFAPFILISLPAGVWVDRLPRRPILIVGDLGRAALLATIPIAYATDALTIWQLYVVGFLFGVLTVFFDVAYSRISRARRARPARGRQLEARDLALRRAARRACTGRRADPGAEGAAGDSPRRAQLPGVRAVRSRHPQAGGGAGARAGHVAAARHAVASCPKGVRYVFGHRYLRWIAASTATFNFFGNVMGAIFLVYAVRQLELSAGTIGLVFAVGNVGYLVGAITANRIARKIGVGPAIVAGAATGPRRYSSRSRRRARRSRSSSRPA